jgi:acyl-CoA dehydrogenase
VVLETENLPGFRVGRRLEKLGQHASDTAELFFDGVRLKASTSFWAGRKAKAFAN